MRVLVSGGAGFIGLHLLETLLEQEQHLHVSVLDDFSSGSREQLENLQNRHHQRLRLIEGTVTCPQTCMQACSGQQAIVHLARQSCAPHSLTDPFPSAAIHIQGSLNLFWAAYRQGVGKIVYASSHKVYGDSSAVPLAENSLGKPLTPYGVSRYTCELYAGLMHRQYHIPTVGLRFFNVYGPGQIWGEQGPALVTSLIAHFSQAQEPIIFGNGNQSCDFVYVNDAVSALTAALHRDIPAGEYNVGSGQRFSVNEICEELQTILKRRGLNADIPPRHLPQRPGDMHHGLAHTALAAAELGYSARTSLADGLEKTVQWFVHLPPQKQQSILENFQRTLQTSPRNTP